MANRINQRVARQAGFTGLLRSGLCLLFLISLSGNTAAVEPSKRPASLSIDHLLYVEGLRLGLDQSAEVIAATGNSLRAMAHHGIEQPPEGRIDRSNPIFRQHVAAAARRHWVQKAPRNEPSESELLSFYAVTQAEYELPASRSFQHLYFRSEQNWNQIREQINNGKAIRSAPHPLGKRFNQISEIQLAERFGQRFANQLFASENTASWQGPLQSNLGFHMVLIKQVNAAKTPTLERIKPTLIARWQRKQQEAWLESKMLEIKRRMLRH